MLRVAAIRQVALPADDLDAAQVFYEAKLGARFIARFDPPGLLFFDCAGVRLLIEKNEGTAGVVYFGVDDIHDACAELKNNGVSLEREPHMIFKDEDGTFGPAGEEEWMAFFKDPAGNTLAFASRQ